MEDQYSWKQVLNNVFSHKYNFVVTKKNELKFKR